jgi:hypothetical protein
MARTKAIFDWIFSINPVGYQLYYLESPDVGISQDALEARIEKETKSLETVKIFAQNYRSLRDVWNFINLNHDLYSANNLVERGRGSPQESESVGDLVKKSYGGNR